MSLFIKFPLSSDTASESILSSFSTQITSQQSASAECLSSLVALAHYIRTAALTVKTSHPLIYSEAQAILFWLRPANIRTIEKGYSGRIGRGLCFQIAPSNVDTLFFYSMCCGLIAGNRVIIRISEQSGEIGDWLLTQLNAFESKKTPESLWLSDNLRVVSYPRTSELTATLSALSDLRVIWGSDQSIAQVQRSPLKSTGTEVTFGHRYSMCLLRLRYSEDAVTAAQRLYTDIKPFHQKACASPVVLGWLATPLALQEQFWNELSQLASHDAPWRESAIAAQDRLVYLQRLALADEPINTASTMLVNGPISNIPVAQLTAKMLDWHPSQGCLLTLQWQSITEFTAFPHCQTLAIFGIDKSELSQVSAIRQQVRRITPLGTSLVFSSTWDGVDLLAACSQSIGDES